jgi:ribonuclease HI
MLCTINTDASFSKPHKLGGYAFWAISNSFKITKSGTFRDKCSDPTDCEIKCIINALMTVIHGCDGVTKIIVNTDSMNAIHVLTNDKAAQNAYTGGAKAGEKYRMSFNKVVSTGKSKPTIEFRHVRAHTTKENPRSWVNDWCDNEARKAKWNKINSLQASN